MTALPNPSFSPTLPYLQLAWDSTSLGLLKECPQKYYYSIILGRVTPAMNAHLLFGLVYHGALETYDKEIFKGADHDTATKTAALYALRETWDYEHQRPKAELNLPTKNRGTLLRTILWYLDRFKNDPLKTYKLENGRPAVEFSFRWRSDYSFSSTGERVTICGHLDRVVEESDRLFVLDRKTTSSTLDQRYYDTFSPHNQFTLYYYVGSIVLPRPISGFLLDAAQVAVTFSRFDRQPITRNRHILAEWYEELGQWLKVAEGYALAEKWPKNETACGNYGGCPYRGICSKAPQVRERLLETDFKTRQWNPLQSRGDI